MSMSTERRVATPHGEARLVTDRARHPVATLLLSHGAGDGIDTRDLEALARHLPAQRHHGGPPRAAVAGRRPQGRDRAGDPRRRRWSPPPTSCASGRPLVVGGRSAGARSAARCATVAGRGRLPGAGLPAAPARAGRRSPGSTSCAAPACRRWSSRASATRWAGPRSSPTTSTSPSSRRPTTASRCRRAAACRQDEAMGIVVEADAGVDRARGDREPGMSRRG